MQAHDLVSENVDLVSLPEICIQVQLMADDPAASAASLGRVIGKDPGLTTRLLRLVNSAYYGFSGRVDTVSRAVSIVGTRELRLLALATSAVEVFERIPNEFIDMVSFWRHAVFCGVLARRLGGRCRVLHDERLFVAGLLHDVGRLLLFSRLPGASAKVLDGIRNGEQDVAAVERRVLGFDHAAVAAELLARWQLPSSLQEAVRCHHEPTRAQEAPLEAALVHIANGITHAIEQAGGEHRAYYDPYGHLLEPVLPGEVDGDEPLAAIDPTAWKLTGLRRDTVDEAVGEAASAFNDVLNVIYPI